MLGTIVVGALAPGSFQVVLLKAAIHPLYSDSEACKCLLQLMLSMACVLQVIVVGEIFMIRMLR